MTLVLAVALPGGISARQVCATPAIRVSLEAGVSGPELWTPSGAPVLGGPFSLAIDGAAASTVGWLATSAMEAPTFVVGLGGSLHPSASQLQLEVFATDAFGRASGLLSVGVVDASLCGVRVVAQAATLGGSAPLGLELSNGLRLEVGRAIDDPLFPPRTDLAGYDGTGDGPLELVTLDLNGDGRMDFATSGWNELCNQFGCADLGVLELRLAGASGGYSLVPLPANLTASAFANGLSAADVDGDGRDDLFMANGVTTDVEILLGQADGSVILQSFASPGAQEVGAGSTLTDLDGDGDPDLILQLQTGLTALLNDGAGQFTPAGTIPGSVGAFLAGEFDGQPGQDLVVWDYFSSTRTVYVGDGLGSFSAAGAAPEFHSTHDLNGDGLDDLLEWSLQTLRVHLASGGGAFAPPILNAYPGSSSLRRYESVDVDGDGSLDLLTLDVLTERIEVLRGNGDGTFGANESYGAGSFPVDLELEGDRLWVASARTREVHRLSIESDGTLVAPRLFDLDWPVVLLTAGDLDADGREDLVLFRRTFGGQPPAMELFLGDEAELFPSSNTLATLDDPRDVVLGDFDGDGLLGLAVVFGSGSFLRVHLDDGPGDLAAPLDLALPVPASRVAAGDLNGDGNLDLVCGFDDGGATSLGVRSFLGDGLGGFSPGGTLSGDGIRALCLPDVDGDGVLDLLALRAGEVALCLGDGTGGFAVSASLAAPVSTTNDLAYGDVSGDGVGDLVVVATNFPDSELFVALGQGGGSFALPFRFDCDSAAEVRLDDVDGDGVLDVLSRDFDSVRFQSFRGGLNGPVASHWAGSTQSHFATLDFDHDGDRDVVSLEQIPTRLRFFVNRTGR